MSEAAEEVRALLLLGRADDAGRRAKELMTIHPEDEWLHLVAAMAWSATGEPALASRSIDVALSSLPDDPEVCRVASIVRERCGDPRAAFTLAQRAVELAPDDVDVQCRLVFAGIARANRAGMLAAKRAASEAIRLAPDEAAPYNAKGAFEMANTTYQLAADAFRTALELEPDNAVYRQNLAGALLKLGRRREASEHLVAAGRADPSSSRAIGGLRRLRKFGGWIVTFVVIALMVVGLKLTDGPGPKVSENPTPKDWPVDQIAIGCGVFVLIFFLNSVRRWRLHPDAAAVLEQDAALRPKRFRWPRRP